MPIGCDAWEVRWIREQIKDTFGNYDNWCLFCAIANQKAAEAWLSTL